MNILRLLPSQRQLRDAEASLLEQLKLVKNIQALASERQQAGFCEDGQAPEPAELVDRIFSSMDVGAGGHGDHYCWQQDWWSPH